jgi:hypothetical protein
MGFVNLNWRVLSMNEREGFFKKRRVTFALSSWEVNTLVGDLKQITLKLLKDKLHGFDFVVRPVVVVELFKEIVDFFLNDFDTVGLKSSFEIVLVIFFNSLRNRLTSGNNNSETIYSSEWVDKISSQNKLLETCFLTPLLERVLEKYLNLSLDKDFQGLSTPSRELALFDVFNEIFDGVARDINQDAQRRSEIDEMDRSLTVEEQRQQQIMVNWWL